MVLYKGSGKTKNKKYKKIILEKSKNKVSSPRIRWSLSCHFL